MSLLSAAVLLFLVMDPLGNIPLFLSALKSVDEARRSRVILRELIIAYAVLLLFLFLGAYFLNIFGITREALRVGGGTILLLIGIRMIFPRAGGVFGESEYSEPLVFPLAIPAVAGPSAMTVVMLLSAQYPELRLRWLAALSIAWMAGAAILLASPVFHKMLGKRGLAAAERLMGMILTAVAVQMFMDGVKAFVHGLGT